MTIVGGGPPSGTPFAATRRRVVVVAAAFVLSLIVLGIGLLLGLPNKLSPVTVLLSGAALFIAVLPGAIIVWSDFKAHRDLLASGTAREAGGATKT